MHVGVLYARLHIPHAQSLKDKRQVVKSVLERARQRFGVAAAEVTELELRQIAGLGFSCVSNQHAHARQIMDKLLETLRQHPVARLLDHELDVV